jgi:hypothetical protein
MQPLALLGAELALVCLGAGDRLGQQRAAGVGELQGARGALSGQPRR